MDVKLFYTNTQHTIPHEPLHKMMDGDINPLYHWTAWNDAYAHFVVNWYTSAWDYESVSAP